METHNVTEKILSPRPETGEAYRPLRFFLLALKNAALNILMKNQKIGQAKARPYNFSGYTGQWAGRCPPSLDGVNVTLNATDFRVRKLFSEIFAVKSR